MQTEFTNIDGVSELIVFCSNDELPTEHIKCTRLLHLIQTNAWNAWMTLQFQSLRGWKEYSMFCSRCDKCEDLQIFVISNLILAFHGQVSLRFIMFIDIWAHNICNKSYIPARQAYSVTMHHQRAYTINYCTQQLWQVSSITDRGFFWMHSTSLPYFSDSFVQLHNVTYAVWLWALFH